MSSDCVLLEQHDAITVLRLNRPPANAFCLELGREIEAALDSEAVRDARALVLTGTGRFFSGGLDLKIGCAPSSVDFRRDLPGWQLSCQHTM